MDSHGKPGIGVKGVGLEAETAVWVLVETVLVTIDADVFVTVEVTEVTRDAVEVVLVCFGWRTNPRVPGPLRVTNVGLVEGTHVTPPEHVHPEKLYPVGMLHAVTAVVPKLVVKNDDPSPNPGLEHVPQLMVAGEFGLTVKFTRAA